jgi:hypothetical protein
MADTSPLARYAPLAAPAVIVVAGWMLLVQPQASANGRMTTDIGHLQQRLAQVAVTVNDPLPPAPAVNPVASFEERVASGDATSELLEELARLAAAAPVSNLLIETGDRVSVSQPSGPGPQAVSGAQPDPRFALFGTALTYSPVTMSFDAEYARAGELLWRLRDLATLVEIRSFEARPVTAEDAPARRLSGTIHVSLTLFAYARPEARP